MRTLCWNEKQELPNVSVWLWDDSVQIVMEPDKAVVGPPIHPWYTINGMGTETSVLYVDVPTLSGWEPYRYTYTVSGWAEVSGYVEGGVRQSDGSYVIPPEPSGNGTENASGVVNPSGEWQPDSDSKPAVEPEFPDWVTPDMKADIQQKVEAVVSGLSDKLK